MTIPTEGDVLSPDKLTKLAKVYIRIREKRADMKKEFDIELDKLSSKMDAISSALDKHCVSNGVKSVKTQGGETFYRKVNTRYFSNNWEAFCKYAIENDAAGLIQQRISTKNLKEYLEQNKDVVIPSLQADSSYSISVRKGKGDINE
tara:strand:- start:176 stop:616 length:441 start_codon:yes stop_codon:yes gene_type:complete